jgi:hypothetical protein
MVASVPDRAGAGVGTRCPKSGTAKVDSSLSHRDKLRNLARIVPACPFRGFSIPPASTLFPQ